MRHTLQGEGISATVKARRADTCRIFSAAISRRSLPDSRGRV